MNHDFSDVTFVTEDKKHINGHKNILSACSPVLKDLITFDDQSNSLIDLSDIHSSEFESVMQFIYFGEATFNEERMEEFLTVAESLKLKGLSNTDDETDESNDTRHEGIKHNCDQCDYQATQQGHLKTHIKSKN